MEQPKLPRLEELIRYVELQTEGASNLDRIAVAESIAYDLGEMADRLTDHFVQRARTAGHSWAEIGRKLGMTKQGAQQRYVLPADESDEALIGEMLGLEVPPSDDPGHKAAVRRRLKKVKQQLHFQRFTDAARQVVVLAQFEARDLGHPYIASEHLLLAMLTSPKEGAGKALADLGIRDDAARQVVVDQLGSGTTARTGHMPFTKEAKKSLELSLREAIRLGHDYIGSEHVLLGLVRGKKGAVEVLEKMGVPPEQVVEQVERMLRAA